MTPSSALAVAVVAAFALAACSKESPRPSETAPAQPPEKVAAAPAVVNAPPPVFADARAKVGPAACKPCHKGQHASWSASPHAAKGLDCEGCHGGGADYVKVKHDRKAAAQVGLVMPKRALCRACHREHWTDDMYFRTHAHPGAAR